MLIKLTFLLCLFLNSSRAYFEPEDADQFQGKDSFNGFKADQFGDFPKKWKLVTVRYRIDTQEMRFTYANPLAWKALLGKKEAFPDGAVFAKVGIKTDVDSSFPAARIPSGAKRIQFMVKDKNKFSSTDGWGYALFDADQKTFPGDPALTIESCHACHKIVPKRDFVFSQPANLSIFGHGSPSGTLRNSLKFVAVKVEALPKAVSKLVPAAYKEILLVEGDLAINNFPGTFDEIRPFLAFKAESEKVPTALLRKEGEAFTLVVPVFNKNCPIQKNPEFHSFTKASAQAKHPKELNFCN